MAFSLLNIKTLVVLRSLMMVSISSIGIRSGSAPVKPKTTAKSVACPFPVKDREPYKSTVMFSTLSKRFLSFNS